MKWKTKDNQLIEISDLTDLHLDNAIVYTRKLLLVSNSGLEKDLLINQVDILEEERKQRFYNRAKKCPWCKKIMKPIQSHPEDDFMPTTRWNCLSCGSTSNTIPNYQKINS